MEDKHLQGPLQALSTILPPEARQELRVRNQVLTHVPIWVQNAFVAYSINLYLRDSVFPLILLEPTIDVEFDQLVGALRLVAADTNDLTVLIADRVNPRFRPLFIKHQIPFIYKNETVFIPQLGFKVANVGSYRTPEKIKVRTESKLLSPMALKLSAALLMGKIEPNFRLHDLHQQFTQSLQFDVSLSKISMNLGELVHIGILQAYGAGPTRIYKATEKAQIWEMLHEVELAPFFRAIHSTYAPKDKNDFVEAGEMALARYTNLALPKINTIAVTPGVFREIKANGVPFGNSGELALIIEVWKEDPRLFSFEKMINPIELYFSMRKNPDERIQMALEKLLSTFNLKPIE